LRWLRMETRVHRIRVCTRVCHSWSRRRILIHWILIIRIPHLYESKERFVFSVRKFTILRREEIKAFVTSNFWSVERNETFSWEVIKTLTFLEFFKIDFFTCWVFEMKFEIYQTNNKFQNSIHQIKIYLTSRFFNFNNPINFVLLQK
jgi:hypothetical protein